MTDAEIIEAAVARIRAKERHTLDPLTVAEIVREALAVCAPAVRAQAMEEAARVADANRQYDDGDPWNVGWNVCAEEIANAIRAIAPPAVAEKGSK